VGKGREGKASTALTTHPRLRNKKKDKTAAKLENEKKKKQNSVVMIVKKAREIRQTEQRGPQGSKEVTKKSRKKSANSCIHTTARTLSSYRSFCALTHHPTRPYDSTVDRSSVPYLCSTTSLARRAGSAAATTLPSSSIAVPSYPSRLDCC
jgi:hypothetical protein